MKEKSHVPQTRRITRIVIPAIAVGILIGFGMLFATYVAGILGRNIPALNISADFSKGVLWAGLLAIVLGLLPWRTERRFVMIFLWAGRTLVTLGLMLVYEWKYGLDAYEYYRMAVRGVRLHTNVFEAGGTHMVGWIGYQINRVLPYLDSYHALKVFWSFLGLFAVYLFYLTYEEHTGRKDRRLLLLLGFFPSLIFWSSTLGKDPLTMLGISCLFYGSTGLLRGFSFRYLSFIFAGVALIAVIRVWIAPIFVVPFFLVILLRGKTNILFKSLIIGMVVFGGAIIAPNLPPFLQVTSQQELVESTSTVSQGWKRGGSAQQVSQIGSLGDMVRFLPKGVFTALFRPLPGEVNNIFGVFSGLENLTLLFFTLVAAFKMRMRHLKDPFVQMLISSIFIWAAFYGFVCAQNLGTAVRFRLQIFPLMVILPYYILSRYRETTDESDTATA